MSHPTPRRAPALLAAVLAAPLLGGCGQRMAAKVNNQVVTQEQFYKRCANYTQGRLIAPPVGVILLNDLINEQLMEQEAKRLKLMPTDAEVNAQVESYRKRAQSQGQSLEEGLKQTGLPMEAFRNSVRLELLEKKLSTQGVTVTDKEVEEFYNQNKQGLFTTPEQVEAKQITVASEAAAKEVMQTLGKNANFDLVARSKSIDTFKDQGGKLPTLTRGYPSPGISPEVISAAFSAPVNKPTQPIKVGNNWVILKVEKRTPQTTKTLAEVKEDLRQMLTIQKAQNTGQRMKFQQRLMELRKDANIDIGMPEFKGWIEDQQKQLRQQPASPVPTLPNGAPPMGQ
jgi:foldase protein PrsA